MEMQEPKAIDQARLEAFVGRFATDLGTIMHATTVLVGDRLGLYDAMADGEPATADELADRTGYDAGLLGDWLAAQAAGDYLEYDADRATFRLPPEHAVALTRSSVPAFLPGGLEVAAATMKAVPQVAEGLRTGAGMGWDAHDPALFHGTERFFRATYAAELVETWLPALDGMHDRLVRGARVADIGCGHGAATILMAAAHPASRFHGFDTHEASIQAARAAAVAAGVQGRVTFEVASATEYPGHGYDLVCFFDSFHDLGHPTASAEHTRRRLADDGIAMLVEPCAADDLADNFTPIGRLFLSASAMLCRPAARAQGGDGLGAQAGEQRLRSVLEAAGFSRVRQAAATSLNLVLEARP